MLLGPELDRWIVLGLGKRVEQRKNVVLFTFIVYKKVLQCHFILSLLFHKYVHKYKKRFKMTLYSIKT